MNDASTTSTGEPVVRIGELARRAGIPPATLRAWERRYGIVAPRRTEAGYRLYTAADERRLRTMVRLIAEGLAPAEAAEQAIGDARDSAVPAPPSGPDGDGGGAGSELDLDGLGERLLDRLEAFDEAGAHRVLDRALAGYGADSFVLGLVLPALRRIGELWSSGELSVGQEHFGSDLLRGRLVALGRGWGAAAGPPILLACPPGERHDIALAGFGLMMRERGRRVALLGSDTPLDALAAAAEQLAAERVVLALTTEEPARKLAEAGRLDFPCPVALAGRAASEELAGEVGAEPLSGDMLAVADRLAATV